MRSGASDDDRDAGMGGGGSADLMSSKDKHEMGGETTPGNHPWKPPLEITSGRTEEVGINSLWSGRGLTLRVIRKNI